MLVKRAGASPVTLTMEVNSKNLQFPALYGIICLCGSSGGEVARCIAHSITITIGENPWRHYVRMLEFLNGVPALITGVASFLAALAALLGLFERRRSKRDEAFQQKIEDTVDKTLINMNKTNEEQQKAIEALRESTDDLNCKLDDMGKSVKNLSAKVEDNELSRLKTTIVDFANQLRMGLKPNSTGFEHVLNIYDRYDHLGGNGYIKTEIEFIREAKKEIEQEEKNKNKK